MQTDITTEIGRAFGVLPENRAKAHRSGPERLTNLLLLWQERETRRRHLAGLDDRLLRDMGLTRADALREAAKPFWRR
ncbi:MAG: DUF1127 domain-containing protein [Alphaproteobacteria bacterium]|nr:DUF1127 domain-containing protein [Alphaproteobacteria bacterium]